MQVEIHTEINNETNAEYWISINAWEINSSQFCLFTPQNLEPGGCFDLKMTGNSIFFFAVAKVIHCKQTKINMT